MSKEKQIEEMRKDLIEIFDEEYEKRRLITADFTAIKMTTKGYRKQSENTIELPCKVGDTVYIIDEVWDETVNPYVLDVKVLQFFINEHGIAVDLKLPLGMRQNTWMVVGKNVFLTEEDAEKALAKMKGGE